jgi:hypothetical protein
MVTLMVLLTLSALALWFTTLEPYTEQVDPKP